MKSDRKEAQWWKRRRRREPVARTPVTAECPLDQAQDAV